MRYGRVMEVKNEGQSVDEAFEFVKKSLSDDCKVEGRIDHVLDLTAAGVSNILPETGTVAIPVSDNYDDDIEEEVVIVPRAVVLSNSTYLHVSSSVKSGAVAIENYSISKKYPKKRVEFTPEISFEVLVNGYRVNTFKNLDEADNFAQVLSDSTDDLVSIRQISGDAASSALIRYEPDYPEMVEVNVQWAVRRPIGDNISHWLFYV